MYITDEANIPTEAIFQLMGQNLTPTKENNKYPSTTSIIDSSDAASTNHDSHTSNDFQKLSRLASRNHSNAKEATVKAAQAPFTVTLVEAERQIQRQPSQFTPAYTIKTTRRATTEKVSTIIQQQREVENENINEHNNSYETVKCKTLKKSNRGKITSSIESTIDENEQLKWIRITNNTIPSTHTDIISSHKHQSSKSKTVNSEQLLEGNNNVRQDPYSSKQQDNSRKLNENHDAGTEADSCRSHDNIVITKNSEHIISGRVKGENCRVGITNSNHQDEGRALNHNHQKELVLSKRSTSEKRITSMEDSANNVQGDRIIKQTTRTDTSSPKDGSNVLVDNIMNAPISSSGLPTTVNCNSNDQQSQSIPSMLLQTKGSSSSYYHHQQYSSKRCADQLVESRCTTNSNFSICEPGNETSVVEHQSLTDVQLNSGSDIKKQCFDDNRPKQSQQTKKKDPTAHRIIEKKRRDRMNNSLMNLSQLIPEEYVRKGRGRIEKTEIIEMAIKLLQELGANGRSTNRTILNNNKQQISHTQAKQLQSNDHRSINPSFQTSNEAKSTPEHPVNSDYLNKSLWPVEMSTGNSCANTDSSIKGNLHKGHTLAGHDQLNLQHQNLELAHKAELSLAVFSKETSVSSMIGSQIKNQYHNANNNLNSRRGLVEDFTNNTLYSKDKHRQDSHRDNGNLMFHNGKLDCNTYNKKRNIRDRLVIGSHNQNGLNNYKKQKNVAQSLDNSYLNSSGSSGSGSSSSLESSPSSSSPCGNERSSSTNSDSSTSDNNSPSDHRITQSQSKVNKTDNFRNHLSDSGAETGDICNCNSNRSETNRNVKSTVRSNSYFKDNDEMLANLPLSKSCRNGCASLRSEENCQSLYESMKRILNAQEVVLLSLKNVTEKIEILAKKPINETQHSNNIDKTASQVAKTKISDMSGNNNRVNHHQSHPRPPIKLSLKRYEYFKQCSGSNNECESQ